MNIVEIEEKGKQIFAKHPKVRRGFKRVYQLGMYTLSNKKNKSEGKIVRVSPNDEYEYFYGYYDKSPWDISDRYMIALRVKNAHKVPDSIETATIVVFDTQNNNKIYEIGQTHCWNTQQGCMAQWVGPNFDSKIIYNDFRDGKFVSVLYDFLKEKEERVFEQPIYDISKDGKFALTLDFTRLHRLRLGYGYANIPETTKNQLCPSSACIWKIDLESGEIEELLNYENLKNFETKNSMIDADHKVNHIMISPNGTRFMFLHRWYKNNEKFTRLVTCNTDGTNMYNLSDDDFVSHCCWKNNNEILSFLNKKNQGKHYYLLKDRTQDFALMWPELKTDGHCTYSPSGKYVITDTYPNCKRIATVYLCEKEKTSQAIARVFSPFKYDNDVRCDLHPRWDHKENKICIDSVHEGKKELYIINLQKRENEFNKIPKIIHSVWVGENDKSEVVNKCYKSWVNNLADYKIYEWTEKDIDFSTVPQYVFDAYKEKKWAFVSDYVRLKKLYEYGGIYLDTDVEIIKDINHLLDHDGFVGSESKYSISTAVIGTKPKAGWIRNLLNAYDEMSFYKEDGTYNLTPNTKLFYDYFKNKYNYKWTNNIMEFEDGVTIYPNEYLSPINPYNGCKNITVNTLAIHHFDNSWKSKKVKIKRKLYQMITYVIGEENRHTLYKLKEKHKNEKK